MQEGWRWTRVDGAGECPVDGYGVAQQLRQGQVYKRGPTWARRQGRGGPKNANPDSHFTPARDPALRAIPPADLAHASTVPTVNPPLSHHEILTLVGPLARLGRRVDLDRSDRHERMLVFDERTHPEAPGLHPELVETLTLRTPRPGSFHLMRTLETDAGPTARAELWTRSVEDAVQAMEALPPAAQFRPFQGGWAAFHHALDPDSPPRILGAETEVAGRRLEVDAGGAAGLPADLRIASHPKGDAGFPDDLLAVLGRGWRLMRRNQAGWKSTLQIPKREPRRSEEIEARFIRTAEHLAQVLSAPPEDFHPRFRRQRWTVLWWRSLWIQMGVLILAVSLLLFRSQTLEDSPWLRMWVQVAPVLLFVGTFFYSSRDVPVIEIPPIPGPRPFSRWEGGDY